QVAGVLAQLLGLEEAPDDFSAPGLRQLVHYPDGTGSGDRPELVPDVLDQLPLELRRGLAPRAEDAEGLDALALDRIGNADDRRLGDGRVADQRALHVGGADAVAGHVQDVVAAPEHCEVAVLVPAGDVARGVDLTGNLLPVLAPALVAAPDGPH